MIYLALLPNPFMHPVAVSDAAAAGQAVAVLPPAAAADFIPSSDGGVETFVETQRGHPSKIGIAGVTTGPSEATHAQQLAEIERLLRLNDTSCERSLVEIAAEEDDVPLFLRQVRRA